MCAKYLLLRRVCTCTHINSFLRRVAQHEDGQTRQSSAFVSCASSGLSYYVAESSEMAAVKLQQVLSGAKRRHLEIQRRADHWLNEELYSWGPCPRSWYLLHQSLTMWNTMTIYSIIFIFSMYSINAKWKSIGDFGWNFAQEPAPFFKSVSQFLAPQGQPLYVTACTQRLWGFQNSVVCLLWISRYRCCLCRLFLAWQQLERKKQKIQPSQRTICGHSYIGPVQQHLLSYVLLTDCHDGFTLPSNPMHYKKLKKIWNLIGDFLILGTLSKQCTGTPLFCPTRS